MTKKRKKSQLALDNAKKQRQSTEELIFDNILEDRLELVNDEEVSKSKAQKWLDENYPKKGKNNEGKERAEITKLDVSNNENLWGSLSLDGFSNLKELNCSNNKITKLDLLGCPKLTKISCWDNQLKSLTIKKGLPLQTLEAWNNQLTKLDWGDFNSHSLISLSISNNNFESQDLDCFARFTNLEELYIGTDMKEKIDKEEYNNFFGSLNSLEKCVRLKKIQIESTNIDSGLEYLPEDFEKIVWWGSKERLGGKSKKIFKQLELSNNDVKIWRKWKELGGEKIDNEGIENLIRLTKTEAKTSDYRFIDYCESRLLDTNVINKEELVEKIKVEYEKYKQAQTWLGLNCKKEWTSLDISSKGLKGELDLSSFVKLRELNCEINELTSLNISKNTELIIVNCSSNKLSDLNLGKKDNLTELDCSNNSLLSELNPGESPNLKKLFCKENGLSVLDVGELIRLEELDCSNNKLTNLQFEKLNNLKLLKCSNNRLDKTEFISDIKIKEKLSVLDISGNSFSEQNLTFLEEFVNLKELRLSKNDFSGSLKILENLRKLKVLDLSETNIDKDPHYLISSRVEEIYCSSVLRSSGKKNTIESELGGHPWLFHKDLNSSADSNKECYVRISSDAKLKPNKAQKWLEIKYNEKEESKDLELDISDEELEDKLNLKKFKKLKYLICYNNKLEEIDLSGCKELIVVDCRENELKKIIFAENSKLKLKEFWGSNNRIKDIHKILSHIDSENLTYLNVGNNDISASIVVFSKFTKLESLYINDNKLIRGSLDDLKELNELFNIDISNTSVEIGKISSESNGVLKKLEEIYCVHETLEEELKKYYNAEDGFYDLKAHRDNRTREFRVDKIIRTPSLLDRKSNSSIKKNKESNVTIYYNEKWNRIIHPSHMEFPWTINKSLTLNRLPFRLYEVDEKGKKRELKKRIECIENKEGENYAILSYVWGKESKKTTKWSPENAEEILSEGGKKSLKKAIETLRIFEEEYKKNIDYLWMDQLCVDQDSDKEKSHEIPKMREYYSNSAITLISIDENVGEEVIRKLSKSFETGESGLIYPNEIIKSSLPILETIVNSEWFSRSWTFQEGFLSKQTVFMFDDYLIDGRFLALIWKLSQNSVVYYDECKKIEELCEERAATPVGWTYCEKGYGIKDKASLRLNEALWAVKQKKRSIPLDGIYSIIGLLPYGNKVKVSYQKEPESVLLEVMLIATKYGHGEPLAWHGTGSKIAGLCWLPEIDRVSGSANVTGVINVNYEHEQELDFEPNKGIKIHASEYIISSVDKSNGMYSLDREEKVDGGIWTRKVWVKNNSVKLTLSGTKEGIKAVSKGRVLLVPNHKHWKSSERNFAILALKVNNNFYHRIDLVRILEENINQDKSYEIGQNEEKVIGLDIQENQYWTEIEVNPYRR